MLGDDGMASRLGPACPRAIGRKGAAGAFIRLCCDEDPHRHPLKGVGRSHETAGHRHCLPDVARDGDGDQIEAADTAVRRIEGDPACARHIDFRPGMG